MESFFKVTDLNRVFDSVSDFPRVHIQEVPLEHSTGRVLAEDVVADHNLPPFARSTMDGFAVRAASCFGASDGNPAYLTVKGSVAMGDSPDFSIGPGQACRISTGGMLPEGADSVVMIEHTEALDDTTLEVYRSVAPGQHVLQVGEDFGKDQIILGCGQRIRSQETGLLAGFGRKTVQVFKQPVIGIISTGDEVVPVEAIPIPGQIRDINSYTLSGQVTEAGGIAVRYGIVSDNYSALYDKCRQALDCSDMVLLSGGSSVGVHGISISPGKPTILAKAHQKAIWGLPGHVVSAMVVFNRVVLPFIEHIAGLTAGQKKEKIPARLSRNLSSAQGRTDFIRVRLIPNGGKLWAEPILGKSGLINTMVKADGLIEIDINTEGLDKGSRVEVIPL
jgi:molybdopterin molybdotransferase